MFDNDLHYAISRIRGTMMLPKDPSLPLKQIREIVRDEGSNNLSRAVIHTEDRQMRIDDFQFCIGPLGYVADVYGRTQYVTRMPMRRDWRQGLRSAQLISSFGGNQRGVSREWLYANAKTLADTIRGVFPGSLFDKLERIEDENRGVPLSRRFAIDEKYRLVYRGSVVGKLEKSDQIKLQPKFGFLIEDLTKAVGSENVVQS